MADGRHTRRRIYPFGDLAVGDRLFVALNGRDPEALRCSICQCARNYARKCDPDFRVTTDAVGTPGFIMVERLGPEGKLPRLIAADEARLRCWQTISRERPLTEREAETIYRQDRRIRLRRAA